MSVVLPGSRVNRWYEVTRPGTRQPWYFFAERYFDSATEALAYRDRRAAELGFDRVHEPVPSHENPGVWAVCVLPERA